MQQHDIHGWCGASIVEANGAADGRATLQANIDIGCLIGFYIDFWNHQRQLPCRRLRLRIIDVFGVSTRRQIAGCGDDDVVGTGRDARDGEASVKEVCTMPPAAMPKGACTG